ncbi:hypothetical protein TWF594_011596 [Orbilia oligospora]|nr:hypothetical protein TWF706_005722 [Orbilia oligospora]KAF3128544.1 hypothetical protein TWF594_011596 [Orbilia oligospora]
MKGEAKRRLKVGKTGNRRQPKRLVLELWSLVLEKVTPASWLWHHFDPPPRFSVTTMEGTTYLEAPASFP